MTTHLLVCGSRWPASFDRDAVRRLTAYVFGALDLWLVPRSPADVVLVHGACERSPDVLAASWAQHRGVRVEAFPVTETEWQEKGPIAGPLRNERMAAFCATGGEVAVVAFYDGASRGTANMLARAEARGWRPIVLRPELLQRR